MRQTTFFELYNRCSDMADMQIGVQISKDVWTAYTLIKGHLLDLEAGRESKVAFMNWLERRYDKAGTDNKISPAVFDVYVWAFRTARDDRRQPQWNRRQAHEKAKQFMQQARAGSERYAAFSLLDKAFKQAPTLTAWDFKQLFNIWAENEALYGTHPHMTPRRRIFRFFRDRMAVDTKLAHLDHKNTARDIRLLYSLRQTRPSGTTIRQQILLYIYDFITGEAAWYYSSGLTTDMKIHVSNLETHFFLTPVEPVKIGQYLCNLEFSPWEVKRGN